MELRIAEATVCDGKFSHKHTFLPEAWRRGRTYLKTSRFVQAVGRGRGVLAYAPAFTTVLPVTKAGPAPLREATVLVLKMKDGQRDLQVELRV